MNTRFVRSLAMALSVGCALMGQGTLRWENDLPAAQKRAKAEKKLIFMDVWTEWCGWCIRLQKNTFPAPPAQAALAKVVPLSVKTQLLHREPTEHKYIEEKYAVNAYPTLIILDADGKEVARNTGYLEPQAFADWINKVVSSRH